MVQGIRFLKESKKVLGGCLGVLGGCLGFLDADGCCTLVLDSFCFFWLVFSVNKPEQRT